MTSRANDGLREEKLGMIIKMKLRVASPIYTMRPRKRFPENALKVRCMKKKSADVMNRVHG